MKHLLCVLSLCLSATATTIYWQDVSKGVPGWGGYGLAGSMPINASTMVPVMPGMATSFSGMSLLTLATAVSSDGLGMTLRFNSSGTFTSGSGLIMVIAGKGLKELFGPTPIQDLSTNIVGLTAANFLTGPSSGGSERIFLDLSGLKFDKSSYIEFDVPKVALIPEPGTLLLMGTGLVGAWWMKKHNARRQRSTGGVHPERV